MIDKILVSLAWGMVVFVRAFQQRNVAYLNYRWVLPTSLIFSCFEVIGITGIATVGFSWDFALMLGTATGLSCMASMYIHKRYVTNDRVF